MLRSTTKRAASSRAAVTSGPGTSTSPIKPGTQLLSAPGETKSGKPFFSSATSETVKAVKTTAEQRLQQIMTMTPGESAKDKGTLFLELRELASFFHEEYAQSQTLIKNLELRLSESQQDRNRLEGLIDEYQGTLKSFEQFTYAPLSQTPQQLETSIKELESDIKRFAFADDIAQKAIEQAKGTGEGVLIRGSGVAIGSSGGIGSSGRIIESVDSALSSAGTQSALTPTGATNSGAALQLSPQLHAQRLVEIKFKLLEDLIFVLKRRLNVFEQNVGLSEAVTQFGSVSEMMDANRRLEEEVKELKKREARYDSSALLCTTGIEDMSKEEMTGLLRALQVELAHANEVIAAYNLEKNGEELVAAAAPTRVMLFPFPSEEKSGSTSSASLASQPTGAGLADKERQPRRRVPTTQEVEGSWDKLEVESMSHPSKLQSSSASASLPDDGAKSEVTPSSSQSSDGTPSSKLLLSDSQMSTLVSKVAVLEQQNAQLQSQVKKLKKTVELFGEVEKTEDSLADLLTGKAKPVGGKTAQLEEMRTLNRELVEEIRKYQAEYRSKDSLITLLTSVVDELSKSKAATEAECASLTRGMIVGVRANRGMKEALRKSERRFRRTALLGIAFGERCLDLMGRGVNGNEVSKLMETFVQKMQGQQLAQQLHSHSLMRGDEDGERERTNRVSVSPQSPQSVRSDSDMFVAKKKKKRPEGESPEDLLNTVKRLFAVDEPALPQSLPDGIVPASSSTSSSMSHQVDGVADYLMPLTELLSSIDSATDGLRQFPVLLRATRTFLVGVVRQSVERELASMNELLTHHITLINQAMNRILLCGQESRQTQTEKRQVQNCGVVTEISGEESLAALMVEKDEKKTEKGSTKPGSGPGKKMR